MARNDKLRARLGLLECFQQIPPQLGEDRHKPGFVVGVMLRLRRPHQHLAKIPIDILPA
jgi:hypothetical protein